MNSVRLSNVGMTANESFARVRRDSLMAKTAREVFPPHLQHLAIDGQANALIAYCFHNQVHVGMPLIGMQDHCVPMD
jgi:hypothetical protein